MFTTEEELRKKVINDLRKYGLHYALETIARDAPKNKLREIEIYVIENFLKEKGDRVYDWTDDDLEGVDSILKNEELPFELRRQVFETLLNFYSRARDQISKTLSEALKNTKKGSELYKITKGLLILMENFKQFAEIKKHKSIIPPQIKPPPPKPPKTLLKKITKIAKNARQILLVGPPGVGKTHLAMWIAHDLTDEGRNGHWVLVQFHRSYRYDDFIERIVLKPHRNFVKLEIEPQIFVKLCHYAEQNPEKKVVLVIDEINRADVASVFGELIYAIEYRGYPVKLAYSKQELIVPENLYIIATANDIDRGTFDIGVALRRRFEIIRIDADEEQLKELLRHNKAHQDIINIATEIFNRVNEFFERIIGKKGIGHLFFRDVKDKNTLIKAWRFRIRPLIETYFLMPGTSRDAKNLINYIETQIKKLQHKKLQREKIE